MRKLAKQLTKEEPEAVQAFLEELQKTMDPKKYVGRAKEQTESFIAKVVNPVLDSHKEMLGMTAEINV